MPLAFGPNPLVKAMLGSVELPQMYLGAIPLLGDVWKISNSGDWIPNSYAIDTLGGTTTNVYNWRYSAWIKPGVQGGVAGGIGCGFGSSSGYDTIRYFKTDHNVTIQIYHSSTLNYVYSAPVDSVPEDEWTHVYVSFDSTIVGRDDWIRMWLNGVEVDVTLTVYSGTINVNRASYFCRADLSQRLGIVGISQLWYNGLIAEMHVLDTIEPPDPTQFGEFINGCWNAIEYTGNDYGNSGWYLPFTNGADVTEDAGPNGYEFAIVGTINQSTDVPEVCPEPVPITIPDSCWFGQATGTYMDVLYGAAAENTPLAKTYSFWAKRTSLGFDIVLCSFFNSTNFWHFAFDDNDLFVVYEVSVGAVTGNQRTVRAFKDVDKWHHYHLAIDTAQAVASNRVRLWVDGVEETEWTVGTQVAQNGALCNHITGANNGWTLLMGTYWNPQNYYYNGMLADFHILDTLQLPPNDFGAVIDGVWAPIQYDGDYGVTGSHFEFADDTNLGLDTSGNGNTFSNLTNITAANQITDTPTNNCVTWDYNFGGGTGWSITWGGARGAAASLDYTGNLRGTFAIPATGKWYSELNIQFINGTGTPMVGLLRADQGPAIVGGQDTLFLYLANGDKYDGDTIEPYGATWGQGDDIGIMVDADTGAIEFTLNGVSQGVAYSGKNIAAGYYPLTRTTAIAGTFYSVFNVGRTGLPNLPAGYLPLVEQNFPPPLSVDSSCMFDAGSSAQMYRDFPDTTQDTNRFSKTHSYWVKRSTLGQQMISCGWAGSTTRWYISFDGSDRLDINALAGGANKGRLVTTATYTDVSAWMHICLAVDTTEAAVGDRVALYVNGVLVTDFVTEDIPGQNVQWCSTLAPTSGTWRAQFGTYYNNSIYFDGILADAVITDGEKLPVTDFGEFDVDGVWQPKAFDGEYGANGFRLLFANSDALGTDYGPNHTPFTLLNITADNGFGDNPTNNCCSLDANFGFGSGGAILEGGTYAYPANSAGQGSIRGTFALPTSGKWYFEHKVNTRAGSDNPLIGIQSDAVLPGLGGAAAEGNSYGYYSNANKFDGLTTSSYGASYTTGDTIGVMIDVDTGEIEFTKNGVSQGVAWTGLDLSAGYWPSVMDVVTTGAFSTIFESGQRGLPNLPAGYLPLIEQNFPPPTVDPDTVMTVTSYTGTGAQRDVITNIDADVVWMKCSSVAGNNHQLYNKEDGPGNYLFPNGTQALANNPEGLNAFLENGFSVGDNTGVNQSGREYTAWSFKNGSPAFEAVYFVGDGQANRVVPHNLGQPPEIIVVKNRDGANAWVVFSEYANNPLNNYMLFNDQGVTLAGAFFGNTMPTDTDFMVNNQVGVNSAGDDYIALLFSSVPGNSKCGKYVGTGTTTGPYIYCGFKPRYILAKVFTGTTGSWRIIDTALNTDSPWNPSLFVDLTNAATNSGDFGVDDNGFQPMAVTSNASGLSYLYIAFADKP